MFIENFGISHNEYNPGYIAVSYDDYNTRYYKITSLIDHVKDYVVNDYTLEWYGNGPRFTSDDDYLGYDCNGDYCHVIYYGANNHYTNDYYFDDYHIDCIVIDNLLYCH